MSNLSYSLSVTKLRNRLPKDGVYEFKMKNVTVSDRKQGATGFITNLETGKVAYVTTDIWAGTKEDIMVRTAKDTKDFKGGHNQYCMLDGFAELMAEVTA